jgi:hypothetical protein
MLCDTAKTTIKVLEREIRKVMILKPLKPSNCKYNIKKSLVLMAKQSDA